MGHNLEQLGTASLDTMGGLVTACNPQDLPEGASPRCWDVDFIIGSVFTRAGLESVYTYTQVLDISSIVMYGSIGTFTYSGATPVVNETFLLGGFTGASISLNGQTITVLSVNAIATTFTAYVQLSAGSYLNLNGTATSTTGNFVGPNVPTQATTQGTGNVWQNISGVLGNTTYASVTSGSTANVNQIPTQAGSLPIGGQALWNNPDNITSSSLNSSITLTSGQTQDPVVAYSGTVSIPTNAIVTGVAVSINAQCSVFGVGSISLQLFNGNTLVAYGTPVNIPVGTTNTKYTAGSSAYTWGTSLTAQNVNGSELGVQVTANVSSGTATVTANALSVTVYYELDGGADNLQTFEYTFTIPVTSGVSGFLSTFKAYTSNASSVSVQLLKNGIAVGEAKTQQLTSTPTIYSLGSASDLWGSTWSSADINNVQFGVQITATGLGTTYINDLDVLTYITPALTNFNYVKSYIQNDGQTYNLALDANGILWKEDVNNLPGVLSVALTGILPGSFAKSATMNNREHIMFSNLSIGTERPRVFDGENFYPLSQGGPGAPPVFSTTTSSSSAPLTVTAYSITSNVVTFTFNTATTPTVGALYNIAGTGNVNLDGFTFSVLGTPPPSTTQFSAATTTATGSASGLNATASPTNFYTISSIKQDSTLPNPFPSGNAEQFFGQVQLWSAGPGSTQPGFTITCYYSHVNYPENAGLLNSFAKGYPVYVYIVGAPIGNGTQLVTGHGIGIPPSETGLVPYFTFTTTSSAYQRYGGPNGSGPNGPGNDGTFQLTLSTLTTASPVANLTAGASVQITGATPSAWNNTWTILDSLLNGSYNITSSQMLAGGVAQFQYSNASATGAPTVSNGQIIELSGLTNLLVFNTTGVVQAATGNTFQIAGFSGSLPAQANPTQESGQAVTFGTKFLFDPGVNYVGTASPSSIFGDTTVPGTVGVVGGSIIPIGAGVRQGVVYFITDDEYETPVSYPVTFTTPEGTNQIIATDIPIGPPNVKARGLAFTEAGQNGVPGQNFYVIEEPVTTVVNGVTVTVPSTIIDDNTTTQLAISFTDSVLLNSREIDIQGDNLFNLIELGSSAWCVPYAGRMFYGLQLNKINNWTSGGSLGFDGGYLPNPTGNIQPLGWSIVNPVDQTLLTSEVTGQALYIKNQNSTTQTVGMIYQTAYQDPYLVAIIQPNTAYSVRVACSAPSGKTVGTLTIDLTDNNPGTGFGTTYGSMTVPLTSMTTVTQVFSGTLLTTPFTNQVSSSLVLRVFLANAGPQADCLIDRIEVYPTDAPYLNAQVYGSYAGQSEAIDGSVTGGIIDTTSENAQPCPGAFVLRDLLYLMKTSSMYSTQDNPNSEPGGWGLKEVSNKVGTIGINSYDTGEGWMVTACRNGIFGFNGGQPVKIMQELWNLWECINWDAGNTIVLRNDVTNKRLYCAIPLPTGVNPATGIPANKQTNVWLPVAPYNPTPTTPNVILMLNYQGMATFEEMINSPEVHTTMFGTLAAVDMKRKWSIWNIATPAMEFIIQTDGESYPLYVCNGIGTSKIYKFGINQHSDDGVAINSLYTTYGFVNAAKAATLPIFGFHAKRYTVLQTAITGGQLTAGTINNPTNATVRILPNTLTPKYPYTVPIGIPLSDPVNDDFFRPINVKGNRAFIEVSTNAVDSWFNLSKLLLTGKADAWSTLNPTGGGNIGIA